MDVARIALCMIATGKYKQFLPRVIDSADRHFCPGHKRTFLVFTDTYQFDLDHKTVAEVRAIWRDHLPWPLPTLLRYHTFLTAGPMLNDFDFVFYVDVDMEFVRPVGNEILGDLVATLHPGYEKSPRSGFTYETNPRSTAFIRLAEGSGYCCGGFQGGGVGYKAAIRRMADNIGIDLSQNIVAEWHDEAHWNRYLIDWPPTIILPPDYCALPGTRDQTAKIIALDKNHAEMRS